MKNDYMVCLKYTHCHKGLISILSLGLGVIMATGCGDNTTPATEPAPTRKANPIVIKALYDGFEGSAVAGFWLPGNYGSGLYVPGDIRVSNNYARSGSQSVEIIVHEGDVAAAGDSNTQVERAELDSGHFKLLGQEAWYGFSVLIPRSFPITDVRLVISSCKQSDVSRPLTAQRLRNGKHTLTIESQGRKKEYRLPDLPLEKWVDFVYRARYSTGDDGLFQVWMNGHLAVSYCGPLADPGSKNAFYHKIGLYRDRMKEPMRIYFDNYSMGTNYDSVDPTRFDANAAGKYY
jgi:hypothetical protein